jgi:hypothetical protein
VEEEAQHRHVADVVNLQADYERLLRSARCESCERDGRPANEVGFPDRDFWPLLQLGRAAPMQKGD